MSNHSFEDSDSDATTGTATGKHGDQDEGDSQSESDAPEDLREYSALGNCESDSAREECTSEHRDDGSGLVEDDGVQIQAARGGECDGSAAVEDGHLQVEKGAFFQVIIVLLNTQKNRLINPGPPLQIMITMTSSQSSA
jgi:hypothetical protein